LAEHPAQTPFMLLAGGADYYPTVVFNAPASPVLDLADLPGLRQTEAR
jgi:hypothetical protein